ncbi:MAG: cytochrome b/b6 domain-containing protein [Bacteroidales bacterium]|nr:cytochrome b/b6 domain-containing protein [Bacteroidales bacterium]MCF8387076.1 cytochrome b/b6 domain-containing protein [Bacteroidales bacterium]MCF8397744.1 cytochrome b/b6 domain-containing protein [Bacteroidales bacterium]
MAVKYYFYPLWLRFWHWLNAVLCILLILTGLSMQYSNPDFPFMRFDLAVSIHNITGILLTASYLIFLVGNMITGNGRYYHLNLRTISTELMKQFKYYTLGLFRGEKPPFPINEKRKFNPLQKISYAVVMYVFIPLLIITGWALLFPEITIHDVFGVSGLHLTDLLHLIIGFFVSVFLIVHIYFSTIGATPLSHFKAMFNGWHKTHD